MRNKTWGRIKEMIGLIINNVPNELISAMGETSKVEHDIYNQFQIYSSNIGVNLAMTILTMAI